MTGRVKIPQEASPGWALKGGTIVVSEERQRGREVAVYSAAIRLSNDPRSTAADIKNLADDLLPYILGLETAKLVVTVTVVHHDWTSKSNTSIGAIMSSALTVDDASVVVTVLPEDDHGDVTADQLVWSSDDPTGAVLTPSLSEDTHTWTGVPVKVGTVNLTITDPTNPELTPTVVTLVVGAGASSQMVATVTVNPAA